MLKADINKMGVWEHSVSCPYCNQYATLQLSTRKYCCYKCRKWYTIPAVKYIQSPPEASSVNEQTKVANEGRGGKCLNEPDCSVGNPETKWGDESCNVDCPYYRSGDVVTSQKGYGNVVGDGERRNQL